MNTHETYVSLEVAKLLKQAGFDWPCNHAICCDSTHYPNLEEGDVLEYNYLECSELMEGKKPHMLLCPTLDVAQRWLREVKEQYVLPYPIAGNWYFAILRPNFGRYYRDQQFDNYESALEAGINKCLTLLLKEE